MRRALCGAVLAAVGVAAALTAPSAAAVPGQCVSSPWGGFCDSPAWLDGSFQHCEQAGFGGFGYSNCFQACPGPTAIPTDTDPATPC